MSGALADADGLDARHERWLEEVAPLILPPEEATFRELTAAQRDEFVRIFWKRRDPDLTTEDNEFREAYLSALEIAAERFRVFGRRGADTDCARVFVVLGEPDEVRRGSASPRPGQRPAETWTYRDRPGVRFEGGEMVLDFDEECLLPRGEETDTLLSALAESKIVHPQVDYVVSNGRLTPLEDLLPKSSSVEALLDAPRRDFATAAEATLSVPAPGGVYVAGLVRGSAQGLSDGDLAPGHELSLSLAQRAVDDEGRVRAEKQREVVATVAPDHSFVVSFGLPVPAGRYAFEVALLDPQSGRGSVISVPHETPEFPPDRLVAVPPVVLRDVGDAPAEPDPAGSLVDFVFGSSQLVPRFGAVFGADESVLFFCPLFGATTQDGAARVSVQLAVFRDDEPVTRAPRQTFETPNPVYAIGPVPLSGFAPGSYVARLTATDELSGRQVETETTFGVEAAAAE